MLFDENYNRTHLAGAAAVDLGLISATLAQIGGAIPKSPDLPPAFLATGGISFLDLAYTGGIKPLVKELMYTPAREKNI